MIPAIEKKNIDVSRFSLFNVKKTKFGLDYAIVVKVDPACPHCNSTVEK